MAHKFQQGIYEVKNPRKYVGKHRPKYRSGWELKFMRLLDDHPNILAWASESHRIPYRNPATGKNTHYVPDFFITYVNTQGKQHVELIEVKPSNQALEEKLGRSKYNKAHFVVNQAKWKAARAWCKQKRIFFRAISLYESGIFSIPISFRLSLRV